MNGLDPEVPGPGGTVQGSPDPDPLPTPGPSAEVVRGPIAPDDLEWVNGMLLQAQKMEILGRLAAGVAHDFNNLLTVIIGVSDLRSDVLPAGDATRADLDVIRGAAERAARLTGQLLHFARTSKVKPVVVDVEERLRETDRMLRRVISEDIALVTRFGAEKPWVFVDPMELDVVLLNLAVNARDAMPSGGKLTIECANSPGAAGDWLEIRVKDTGVGMTPEVIQHLFEPFFTTKEIGRGTGLGLAACHGIVTSAGGSIRVESKPGHGSEFIVAFPACAEGPEDPGTLESHAASRRGSGETLMLVEDDPAVRHVCEEVLRQHGYRVLCASDGMDALGVADRNGTRIDLLVSDLVMKGMGGQALFERLRLRHPGLRVLFMSGYNEDELHGRSIQSPEGTLLRKPFKPVKLARRVRAALDGPREAAG
jgi:two-component system, cell cycle sensor histidine kinase and response regulator CckA